MKKCNDSIDKTPLPQKSPPKAYALEHYQQARDSRIDFLKGVTFS
jgi:hypothetical protein